LWNPERPFFESKILAKMLIFSQALRYVGGYFEPGLRRLDSFKIVLMAECSLLQSFSRPSNFVKPITMLIASGKLM